MYALFLCLLLLPIAAIHSMEKEDDTQNVIVYTLFMHDQPTQAQQIIPRKQPGLSSLFIYGVEQNNPDFMQWLLDTEKPLYDERCIKESFKLSSSYDRPKITSLLETYIKQEKTKLKEDLIKYAEAEKAKIKNHQTLTTTKDRDIVVKWAQPVLESSNEDIDDCRCIIS